MHEKGLSVPILVPHQKVECGVLFQQSLDLEISQFCDFFLDLVFLGDVGDRRWLAELGGLAFLWVKPVGDRFLQGSLYVDLVIMMALSR